MHGLETCTCNIHVHHVTYVHVHVLTGYHFLCNSTHTLSMGTTSGYGASIHFHPLPHYKNHTGFFLTQFTALRSTLHVYTHALLYTYMYIRTCTCTCTNPNLVHILFWIIYMYVCTCIHSCIYMYIRIYLYS